MIPSFMRNSFSNRGFNIVEMLIGLLSGGSSRGAKRLSLSRTDRLDY